MTTDIIKPKKQKKHYLDNVRFTKEAVEYVDLYNYNKEHGLPKPSLNNYLGESLILLAHKVSCMPAFSSYIFKDEMILDAIEIAVRYFHNFDVNAVSLRTGMKSAGAHSYFTQIMARRMFKKRTDEKLQMFIKQRFVAQSTDLFAEIEEYDSENYTDELKGIIQEMSGSDYIEYDKKLKEKKELLLKPIKIDSNKNSMIKAKAALDEFLQD